MSLTPLLSAFAAASWAGVCPGGQDHHLFATRRRDSTFDSHFMGVGYVCPDYTPDLDTASAGDETKCAGDCGDKPTCMAVSYDHIHGTCRLCTSQVQVSTTAWTTYSVGPCITCAAGATYFFSTLLSHPHTRLTTQNDESCVGRFAPPGRLCQPCVSGKWSGPGKSSCNTTSQCPPGSFCPVENGAALTPCPVGTFSPAAGATERAQCLDCPEGFP